MTILNSAIAQCSSCCPTTICSASAQWDGSAVSVSKCGVDYPYSDAVYREVSVGLAGGLNLVTKYFFDGDGACVSTTTTYPCIPTYFSNGSSLYATRKTKKVYSLNIDDCYRDYVGGPCTPADNGCSGNYGRVVHTVSGEINKTDTCSATATGCSTLGNFEGTVVKYDADYDTKGACSNTPGSYCGEYGLVTKTTNSITYVDDGTCSGNTIEYLSFGSSTAGVCSIGDTSPDCVTHDANYSCTTSFVNETSYPYTGGSCPGDGVFAPATITETITYENEVKSAAGTTYADEFTTAALLTYATSQLPAFPDTWDDTVGGSSAYTSEDNKTRTLSKSRLRFLLTSDPIAGMCIKVSYVIRWTPVTGDPVDTPQCFIATTSISEDYDPDNPSTWPVIGSIVTFPVPATDGAFTLEGLSIECANCTTAECPS